MEKYTQVGVRVVRFLPIHVRRNITRFLGRKQYPDNTHYRVFRVITSPTFTLTIRIQYPCFLLNWEFNKILRSSLLFFLKHIAYFTYGIFFSRFFYVIKTSSSSNWCCAFSESCSTQCCVRRMSSCPSCSTHSMVETPLGRSFAVA